MADKPYESRDPMELVGAVYLDDGEAASIEEMGRCFVEEFLRMGWPAESILTLFADPFYRGPHAVYCRKGRDYVRTLIESVSGADRNGNHPQGER